MWSPATLKGRKKKNGTKWNPPLFDSLPTYCIYPTTWNLVTTLNQFSNFFLKLQYYIILYPAVNTFLHNVFRVCLNGGGEPQIGEVKCGGSPHLWCNCDQIKMRDYMDKRDTPPKRVTSRTWGSPPPCKQTLCHHHHLVISVSMKF